MAGKLEVSKQWERAAAMVHRLTSELHDMDMDEQDFVMSVLGNEDVGPEAIQALNDLCDKFDV